MDWVRSCYDVEMSFRPGDPPVKVRWHFAKEGAGCFPLWHGFYSHNWEDRRSSQGSIGELEGARPWYKGTKLERGAEHYLCSGIDSWWENGIPVGQQAPPVDAFGVPLCCAGISRCGCVVPASLVAHLENVVAPACPWIAGLGSIPLAFDPINDRWSGSRFVPDCLEDVTITIYCDIGLWWLRLGPVVGWADVSTVDFSCPPFRAKWTNPLLLNWACCFNPISLDVVVEE